jgi:hypothetical protein
MKQEKNSIYFLGQEALTRVKLKGLFLKGRLVIALARGWKKNPLLDLPKTMDCPCQSKKQFQKCCLFKLPKAVSEKEADQLKQRMADLATLVFCVVTDETEIEQNEKRETH